MYKRDFGTDETEAMSTCGIARVQSQKSAYSNYQGCILANPFEFEIEQDFVGTVIEDMSSLCAVIFRQEGL